MDPRYYSVSFVDRLWKQISPLLNSGRGAMLFWGLNDTTRELISRIEALHLENRIVGIVDSDPANYSRRIGSVRVLPQDSLPKLNAEIIVITMDKEKEQSLELIASLDKHIFTIVMAGNSHMEFNDNAFDEIYSSCLIPSRAFGYRNMLIHIYQSLCHIARNDIRGNVAEFGVYRAGTTVFMAKVLKSLNIDATIYAFDTFKGFPPKASTLDMYDDSHDEFFDFDAVAKYCNEFDIELVKGDIRETYHKLKGMPLALTFFDTDNYSPTYAALELCYNQTVPRGILAFDHYFCDERWLYTLGERIAVKKFLKDKNVLNLYGTGIFIKF